MAYGGESRKDVVFWQVEDVEGEIACGGFPMFGGTARFSGEAEAKAKAMGGR